MTPNADIPTYDQFVFPLLQILARYPDGIRARDAYEAAADALGLTPEARAEVLPSGLQPIYQNRIGWAHDRLKRRGLSASPRRGEWKITEEALISLKPGGQIERWQRGRSRWHAGVRAGRGWRRRLKGVGRGGPGRCRGRGCG